MHIFAVDLIKLKLDMAIVTRILRMQISEQKYINLYVNIVVFNKIKISLDSNW